MASKSNLFQRVVQLIGRGITKPLQIINKIKQTPSGRNINVRYIKQNIVLYDAAKQSAKALGSTSMKAPIGESIVPVAQQGRRNVRVNFHFGFLFGPRTSSGRHGHQGVYMSIDLPANTPKRTMQDRINEMVREWVEEHYEEDPQGRTNIRVTLDLAMGV